MPTKAASKPVQAHTARPIDDLARAVLKSLVAGNGRSNRCEVKTELPERLAADNVKYDPAQLQLALVRLEDVGLVHRVQRQPYGSYPQFIVSSGLGRYDGIDEFENEPQLSSWLDQGEIPYTEQTFSAALAQLEQIGRIKHQLDGHPPVPRQPPACSEQRAGAALQARPGPPRRRVRGPGVTVTPPSASNEHEHRPQAVLRPPSTGTSRVGSGNHGHGWNSNLSREPP
jgi:hypothetical protein